MTQPKLNETWDLQADGNGDLALCSGAYERVQAVVNECRLLKGEAWWDTRQGIPWASEIMANKDKGNAVTLLRGAALGVDGVEAVEVTVTPDRATRVLSTSLTIMTEGEVYNAAF